MKNKRSFLVMVFLGMLLVLAFTQLVWAEGEGGELLPLTKGLIALAGGLGISFAAGVGVIGQAISIAAGLYGIARNPGASDQILTPLIIGLAFQESLVLYVLVVAFTLILKF